MLSPWRTAPLGADSSKRLLFIAWKGRDVDAKSRLRSVETPERAQMKDSVLKLVLAVAATSLLLGLPACAGWSESESDAIRRVVIAYELDDTRTRVDDLVVRLSPREFRADLGHDGRMVWLVSNGLERKYREGEYFRLRDPGRSYLFVQDIQHDSSGSGAKVRLVLYLVGDQPLTYDLTLRKAGSDWEVVSGTPVG